MCAHHRRRQCRTGRPPKSGRHQSMYEETEMTRNTASDLSKGGYAAILLGVAIGGFVGFGCFFFPSLAIFMRPVLAEFGWGRTELSLVFSASLLGCAFGGPVCGHFIDRFGVRRAAFTSALLLGLLIFVLSSVHGSVFLIASLTFAIGFCGAATTSLVMAGCMFAASILVATLGRYQYATQPSAAGAERTRASALSLPVD
ncbi:MFS transporter [Burkholderia cepacia]|uniref:MFS transporter n=1 Tax=Burkholderia cepacia TaxID=292 RepID=UPI001CF25CA7|nr:MFS transporter [Burkholderia cepacia]MCA8353191.1 MFS transporter [Burkholderia cepacia]